MSRFAVFGMTKTYARQKADKLQVGRTESQAAYEARVEEEFSKTWQSNKSVKASNLFDAPQYAAKFIEIGEASGDLRNGVIRVHAETKRQSKKTGKPVRKWINWVAA